MKFGRDGQFDTLKKRGCRHKLKNAPCAIFRVGYWVAGLKKVYRNHFAKHFDTKMKFGSYGQFDALNKMGCRHKLKIGSMCYI